METEAWKKRQARALGEKRASERKDNMRTPSEPERDFRSCRAGAKRESRGRGRSKRSIFTAGKPQGASSSSSASPPPHSTSVTPAKLGRWRDRHHDDLSFMQFNVIFRVSTCGETKRSHGRRTTVPCEPTEIHINALGWAHYSTYTLIIRSKISAANPAADFRVDVEE